MKSKPLYILLFTGLALFFLSCESSKSVTNNSKISKIILEKSSMQSLIVSEITKNEIATTVTFRDGSTNDRGGLSVQQWNELNRLIRKIDLNKFDQWEAPTQARLYDGAAATTIIIETNGESFRSLSFDEGEPPAELKEFYTYLESLVNQ